MDRRGDTWRPRSGRRIRRGPRKRVRAHREAARACQAVGTRAHVGASAGHMSAHGWRALTIRAHSAGHAAWPGWPGPRCVLLWPRGATRGFRELLGSKLVVPVWRPNYSGAQKMHTPNYGVSSLNFAYKYVRTRIPTRGLLLHQQLMGAYVVCRRWLCANRTKVMDSVCKMDPECIQMPRRILEVVLHKTDIVFGFSAEKR